MAVRLAFAVHTSVTRRSPDRREAIAVGDEASSEMLRPAQHLPVPGRNHPLVTHATPTVLRIVRSAHSFRMAGRLLAHGHPNRWSRQSPHSPALCSPESGSGPGEELLASSATPWTRNSPTPGGAGLRPPRDQLARFAQFPAPQHRQTMTARGARMKNVACLTPDGATREYFGDSMAPMTIVFGCHASMRRTGRQDRACYSHPALE